VSTAASEAAASPPIVPPDELFDARSDPLAFLERASSAYGDIFAYHLMGWDVVVINDPATARQALQCDGAELTKLGTPDLMMLRPMLGAGLMTNEGEEWSLTRHASQPSFAPARIQSYLPEMLEAVDEMLDLWSRDGPAERDLEREFSRLTLRIVGACLFDSDFAGRDADIGPAVEVMNRCVAHFDPADRAQFQRFAAAHAELHATVQGIVDGRSGAADLLSALADRCEAHSASPERALRDEIITFAMAGHETTAKTLTWAMHELAANPEAADRIRAEAASVFGPGGKPTSHTLDSLSWTWQVVQEVLRLHPPVWLLSRRARTRLRLDSLTVEEGTLVVVSPWLLHRHPGHWTDPLRFDPDRFAGGRAPGRSNGAYMPFGAGHRVCIGRLFASAETVLALARIVSRFDCRHASGEPVEPEALVTLRPRHGMRMRVLEREIA
jgi:cytochrome P450